MKIYAMDKKSKCQVPATSALPTISDSVDAGAMRHAIIRRLASCDMMMMMLMVMHLMVMILNMKMRRMITIIVMFRHNSMQATSHARMLAT